MTSAIVPRRPAAFRGEFFTDLNTRSAYSEGAGPYRIVPDAVAVPQNNDDLRDLIAAATQEGFALVPRGAGSGLPGGNVGSGVVVDLQRFGRPRKIFPERGANVGAAVTWGALTDAANWHGLRLPPDPSSGNFCTIGGMVATNAAGARSTRFGSIRRWVRGIELVTVDGEAGWLARSTASREPRHATRGQPRSVVDRLQAEDRFDSNAKPAILANADLITDRYPKTSKNSSGYALDAFLMTQDLVDLVIGSEGTLGFVTRIELDLEPLPLAVSTVLLALKDVGSLPDAIRVLRPSDPVAIELFDRSFIDFAGGPAGIPTEGSDAILLVEFERDNEQAARAAAADAVREAEQWCVQVQTGLTEEERQRLWTIRHSASPQLAALGGRKRSLQIVEDGCVPVDNLANYLLGVRAAGTDLGIDVVAFGHAGDGHLHVNALVDVETDFEPKLEALLARVTNLLVQLGGTPSGEHGDGRLRAPLLEQIYGSRVVELFRMVKQAFDPRGILNPGVILADPGTEPLSHLKVGRAAAQIPDGVAAELYEIERSGRWGTSKLEMVRAAAP